MNMTIGLVMIVEEVMILVMVVVVVVVQEVEVDPVADDGPEVAVGGVDTETITIMAIRRDSTYMSFSRVIDMLSICIHSTPYNTRGNYGSQRGGRGDSRGGNRRGSVFSRLGLANKQDNTKKGGVFGRLSLGKDDFNQSQTWHKIMVLNLIPYMCM